MIRIVAKFLTEFILKLLKKVGLVIVLVFYASGCLLETLPVEVDSDIVESRVSISPAQIKHTLGNSYGVDIEELGFPTFYEEYKLYSKDEIESHFEEIQSFIQVFEWHENRSCVWKAAILRDMLFGYMLGLPCFTISLFPDLKKGEIPERYGHMYVGIIYKPLGRANRKCLVLDHRYAIDDSRQIGELPYGARIGSIQMAPEMRE